MNRAIARTMISLALFIVGFAGVAVGQIPVSDDTFTSSCSPSSGFGSSIALIVQSSTATGSMASPAEPTGCNANAYVRFDVKKNCQRPAIRSVVATQVMDAP
jgi:hypothetical protein